MKHCGLDVKQLLRMLHVAIQKEHDIWTPVNYKQVNTSVEISPENRDETVRWLAHLNKRLKLHSETLAMSVVIMDRFLALVKAHVKYLKVIAVTCLFLSAKMLEEDMIVPPSIEFIRESKCGCSLAELIRMEKAILGKLGWDLRNVTCLDFMYIFHALLLTNFPQYLTGGVYSSPSRQMSLLTYKLQLCSSNNRLLVFSPSTIAIAVLSLELETYHRDWFTIIDGLQNMTKVDSDQLILCRDQVSNYFSSMKALQCNPVKYVSSPPSYCPASSKASKRKVQTAQDTEDVLDAIKRLYSDEGLVSTCSSELRYNTAITATSLHTTAVN